MANDVEIKSKIVVDTGDGEEKVSRLKSAIKGAGGETGALGGTFGKLKESIANLPGPTGQATQSVGLFTQALNVLKAHPIVGIVILLAGLIMALWKRFSEMEAVSDTLGAAWANLSGIFDTFLNKILAPLIEGFSKFVGWIVEGVDYIVGKFSPALAEAGKQSEKLAKQLDDLEDQESKSAVARERANRLMQEAREKAADANLPIKERIAALKEAAKIERETLEESIQNNITHARIIIAQSALKIGATEKEIEAIKKMSSVELDALRIKMLAEGKIKKDELNKSVAFLINAESEGATLAKIEKKTQSQISSIQSEENNKRKAATDKVRSERENAEKEFTSFMEKEHERRLKLGMNAADVELYELNKKYERIHEIAKKYGLSEKQLNELRIQDDVDYINKSVKGEESKWTFKAEAMSNFIPKQIEMNTTIVANNDAANKLDLANARMTADQKQAIYAQIGNAMSAFSELVGRETVAGKAMAIATATINTYLAASKALAADYSTFGPAALAAKIAAVASTIAMGLAQVKSIAGTQVPGKSSTSSLAVAAPLTPPATTTALDQSTINSIGNAAAGGVNRAFVLDADITNNAERNARINRAARLG